MLPGFLVFGCAWVLGKIVTATLSPLPSKVYIVVAPELKGRQTSRRGCSPHSTHAHKERPTDRQREGGIKNNQQCGGSYPTHTTYTNTHTVNARFQASQVLPERLDPTRQTAASMTDRAGRPRSVVAVVLACGVLSLLLVTSDPAKPLEKRAPALDVAGQCGFGKLPSSPAHL